MGLIRAFDLDFAITSEREWLQNSSARPRAWAMPPASSCTR